MLQKLLDVSVLSNFKSYLWFWNVIGAKNSILCAKIQTLVNKVDMREEKQGFLFSPREKWTVAPSLLWFSLCFPLNGSMKNRLNAISNSFLFIKEAGAPHYMLCHQKSFSHTVLLNETFLTHNRNFESASWRWYIKSFKRLQLWNPHARFPFPMTHFMFEFWQIGLLDHH